MNILIAFNRGVKDRTNNFIFDEEPLLKREVNKELSYGELIINSEYMISDLSFENGSDYNTTQRNIDIFLIENNSIKLKLV